MDRYAPKLGRQQNGDAAAGRVRENVRNLESISTLGTGHWLLVPWVLVIGYWYLGYWSLVTGILGTGH